MRKSQLTRSQYFSKFGGVNTTVNPALLTGGQFASMLNWIRTDAETLKKRGGFTRQSSQLASAAVKGAVDYWRAGSSGTPTRRVVAACSTSLFSSSDGGFTFSNITGSTSMSADSTYSFAVVGDNLVIASSEAVPQVYTQTGNAADLTGSPPNGSIVREHLGRLWINEKTNPHQLHYTGPFDPTFFSSANGGGTLSVYEDDGDPVGITAIFPSLDGEMYVAKLTKIYRVVGRTKQSFSIVPVSDGLGCISHNSIVAVGNDYFFPSLRGWHSLANVVQAGGISKENYLSRDVHKTFTEDINLSRAQHFKALFYPDLNSIIWFYAEQDTTVMNRALVFHLSSGQWFMWQGGLIQAPFLKYNSTSNKMELWGGDSEGYIRQYNSDTMSDNGTAIPVALGSGLWYPDDQFPRLWSFQRYYLEYVPKGNYDLEVSFRSDLLKSSASTFTSIDRTINTSSGGGVPLGMFVLGVDPLGDAASGRPKVDDVEIGAEGRYLEIIHQNDGSNSENFEIIAQAIEAVRGDIVQENV